MWEALSQDFLFSQSLSSVAALSYVASSDFDTLSGGRVGGASSTGALSLSLWGWFCVCALKF